MIVEYIFCVYFLLFFFLFSYKSLSHYSHIFEILFLIVTVIFSAFIYKEQLITLLSVVSVTYLLRELKNDYEKIFLVVPFSIFLIMPSLFEGISIFYILPFVFIAINIQKTLYALIFTLSLIVPMVYESYVFVYSSLLILFFVLMMLGSRNTFKISTVESILIAFSMMNIDKFTYNDSNLMYFYILILFSYVNLITKTRLVTSIFFVSSLLIIGVKSAFVFYIMARLEREMLSVLSSKYSIVRENKWLRSIGSGTLFSPSIIFVLTYIGVIPGVLLSFLVMYKTYTEFRCDKTVWKQEWYTYFSIFVVLASSLFYMDSPWSFYLLPDIFEASNLNFSYVSFIILMAFPIVHLSTKHVRYLEDIFFKIKFYQNKPSKMSLTVPKGLSKNIDIKERYDVNYLGVINSYVSSEKSLLILLFAVFLLWRLI